MKNFFLFSLGLIVINSTFSQTGPAGVGTSATNVFWIKADAGTSSTVNATPISSWNDQSGNAINVTQTVAAQQPSFVTNVLNGFPGIQFDNVSGNTVADRMFAPDNPSLDNTPGYSFFTVTKMTNIGSDARSVISKRTAVDVDEAFMLFYWNTNRFYVDVDGLGNRFDSSPTTYVNNVGYIFDVFFDGTLPAASRSTLYEEEILRKTAAETSTLVPDKPSPLNIGCTHGSDGRPFGGYILEVMIYTVAVNPAQRIIVNNYLSAKYDIALSANNKYAGDDAINGDYDFEVAGIGIESTGSNPSFSASTCGGLGISATGVGFDNGDYILAGHASYTNTQITSDIGGMTGINNARWQRVWYVDVTNTLTNINTNIEFDMSDGDVGVVALSTHTNYVLLYRATQAGNWTELTAASAIVGDRVLFNGVNLINDGYYTIGTHDYLISPLPIALIKFEAIKNQNQVDVLWATASEKANKTFVIEKTKDGITYETVAELNGEIDSKKRVDYKIIDTQPYTGLSYYRLKQIDLNGKITYSKLEAVNFEWTEWQIKLIPNPAKTNFNIQLPKQSIGTVDVFIYDVLGKKCFAKSYYSEMGNNLLLIEPDVRLAKGTYFVSLITTQKNYRAKLIIED